MKTRVSAVAFVVLMVASSSVAQTRVAATPPMGWNSWNHFFSKVSDADVRSAADALVATGMRDAGYTYVNIDDAWQGKRDANGVLHPNEKFPDMKALADYVHSKGLKFGIYSSPGPQTCAHYEGSYGHEQQDAELYASWGVDYLKYDLCSFGDLMKQSAKDHPEDKDTANRMMREAYSKMADALRATGRPILFSLCQYGLDEVWKWAPSIGGNTWRTTYDIHDTYGSMSEIGFGQSSLAPYAGPGHWNDPDMLEVGNGGMTEDEYKTHFSLWSILAAPLLAGNDLAKMTASDRSILMNREVIRIDQDALGSQGKRLSVDGTTEIWVRTLSGGDVAVALFNRGQSAQTISFESSATGLTSRVSVRDLWAHRDLGTESGRISATVVPHGVVMFRLHRA